MPSFLPPADTQGGGRRGVGSGRRRRRRVGRERQRGRQEQMRRAWEREGWRRAELQWVQRQDARWRSKGGKGVSWRLRQRKQRRRRLATASNAMQRLPARGIGPGTGRQGPLQRGVGRASRRQRQKRLRAGKEGAGASGWAPTAAAWRRGEAGVGDVARAVPLASGATPVALTVRHGMLERDRPQRR